MKLYSYILLLALSTSAISCQQPEKKALEISDLFSNHMILQQQSDVAFWGEYTPGETLTIMGSWGNEVSAIADVAGKWAAKLATPKAGGPYSVDITSNDTTIKIEDVLIGEVWLASGQSNMQMPLKGWPPNDPIQDSEKEIAQGNYPNIRMLTVARNMSDNPLDTINGKWASASPETVGDFSASAYFFARRLHQELNIPIGIIHSSWGGTVAEAWTSKEYLKKLGDFDEAINILDNATMEASKIETANWFDQWPTQSIPDSQKEWDSIDFSDLAATKSEYNDGHWTTITLPGQFDELPSGVFDGAIWLRRTFEVEDISSDYQLNIGAIDDMDATYINGQKVGGLAGPGVHATARVMNIPRSLLVKGSNVIAIRAIDTGGPGAVTGPMTISSNKGSNISIEGEWRAQVISEIFEGKFYAYDLKAGTAKRPKIYQFHPNLPTVLYNAMINPLVPYTIKGAIWYQGESNVGRAEQYQRLFPAMIKNWRDQWDNDFPFYFVQIAPFTYNPNPDEQVSQELRDAQRLSLSTQHTGMVVTLDVGNPTNIHPANKQDVGKRLAGLALANDYNQDIVSSGPLFKAMKIEGSKITIAFDHIGSGLVAGKTGLSGFEIAGADKIYTPAIAKIIGNTIEVASPSTNTPQHVRYAWRDDSGASLFNKEGLPASSFTTEK